MTVSALKKLHLFDGYIQTIYLAEYKDKLLLLDGCSRVDVKTIVHFITQKLNRSLFDLKMVVVTHMHPDHAGAAQQLRHLTGCKIAASNTEGQWYHGLDGILMHLTDMMLIKWVATRKGKSIRNVWYKRTLTPDIYLNDGDLLPDFNDWQALQTPGHTDRDISLFHIPSQKVYVADLMVIVKNRFIPPFPIFYPHFYRASVNRIFALKPKGIYLAHSGEVHLNEQDIIFLKSKIPKHPVTHWQSIKNKFTQSFFKKFPK